MNYLFSFTETPSVKYPTDNSFFLTFPINVLDPGVPEQRWSKLREIRVMQS